MSYTEGTHDSPADTNDRLVRIGTKYQATAPAVADGDNVYLLVDSAGRLLIAGALAHDAVGGEFTFPVIGGGVHKAILDPVSDKDVVHGAFDSEGRFVVSIGSSFTAVDAITNGTFFKYRVDQTTAERLALVGTVGLGPDDAWDRQKFLGNTAGGGLGVLAAAPWIPGASDVKTITATIGATSASRNTALTPTSGKKVRIISIDVAGKLTTAPDRVGIYFGTGAAYTTNPASAIAQGYLGTTGDFSRTWPDGGGPVGAVDEVVSWITETETETGMDSTITYREE